MILSSKRPFKREPPSEEAKLFLLVVEGSKRESQYFNYFSEIDSRINVEIIKPEDGDDNSPTGLINKVRTLIETGSEGQKPKYELTEGDEIWFVFDTDAWGDKIDELKGKVASESAMFVAQSNPCFEVWLCYHFAANRQDFVGMHEAVNWKSHLDELQPGGFDSKRHPLLIAKANEAAKVNYSEEGSKPLLGATQVFRLGENIYKLIGAKIDSALWRKLG